MATNYIARSRYTIDPFEGIDLDEEAAWLLIEIRGWSASPELLMYTKQAIKDALKQQADSNAICEGPEREPSR